MGAFYATPAFTGDVSEAAQVAEAFPSAPDGTLLRQVDEGTLEASYPGWREQPLVQQRLLPGAGCAP